LRGVAGSAGPARRGRRIPGQGRRTLTTLHPGGCLCGKARFEAAAEPLRIVHCHCVFCRRQTGGPLATLAGRASGARPDSPGRAAPRRSVGRHPPSAGRSAAPAAVHYPTNLMVYRNEIYLVIGAFDEPDRLPPTPRTRGPEYLVVRIRRWPAPFRGIGRRPPHGRGSLSRRMASTLRRPLGG